MEQRRLEMGEKEEEKKKVKERKTRKDKGQILLTGRDLSVLSWIGEMYGVRFDQLQYLLGRAQHLLQKRVPRLLKEEGKVTEADVRRIVKRWEDAGLAASKKLLVAEPAWVWLTPKGLRELGLPYKSWSANPYSTPHIYWVNQARLFAESRRGQELAWTSERQLKSEKSRGLLIGDRGVHYVDAEVEFNNTRIAVEVELTQKQTADLLSIMAVLGGDARYQGIWYFTSQKSSGAVQRAYMQLNEAAQQKFRFYDLEVTREHSAHSAAQSGANQE